MVLGKLPVPGRPTILITVGQGPIALAVGAGGGGLDIFTLIYPFSSFSLSLGDGPIWTEILSQRAVKPKPTNQPTNQGHPSTSSGEENFYRSLPSTHGGHVGHVTWTFLPSAPGGSVKLKFGYNWPSGFGKDVWNFHTVRVLNQRTKNDLDFLYSQNLCTGKENCIILIFRLKSSELSMKSYALAFSHI